MRDSSYESTVWGVSPLFGGVAEEDFFVTVSESLSDGSKLDKSEPALSPFGGLGLFGSAAASDETLAAFLAGCFLRATLLRGFGFGGSGSSNRSSESSRS